MQLTAELSPCLKTEKPGALLLEWVTAAKRDMLKKNLATNDFLVAVNQRLQGDIAEDMMIANGLAV